MCAVFFTRKRTICFGRRRGLGRARGRAVRAAELYAGVRPRLVPVRVARGGIVVDNVDALDIGRERAVGKVRLAPGPLDRPGRVAGVAPGPDPQLHPHRGLRVILAVQRRRVVEGPLGDAVDLPGEGLLGPYDRVVVEIRLGVVHVKVLGPVVRRRVAFAKVIRLHRFGRTTKPLPINLVEVVGLENDAADDTSSRGGLHTDGHFPEEQVPGRLHGRSVSGLRDGEFRAVLT